MRLGEDGIQTFIDFRIAQIYTVEKALRGRSDAERRADRQAADPWLLP